MKVYSPGQLGMIKSYHSVVMVINPMTERSRTVSTPLGSIMIVIRRVWVTGGRVIDFTGSPDESGWWEVMFAGEVGLVWSSHIQLVT